MDEYLVTDDGMNKQVLFCINCSSKILLANTGTFTKCEMELPRMTQKKGSTEVETDLITECFQLTDVLQFENIGSTKPVDNVKYLACADCELGPVGWQGSSGTSCFVALSRVQHGKANDVPPSLASSVDENAN